MLRQLTIAALLASAPGMALAMNVTPDVIFGSGNANGSFTLDRRNGVELGLRAKLRFNSSNLPENTFNYDGVDTYTFAAGTPPTGFSFAPNSPTTPIWNFEWSVNTDFEGTTGKVLDDLTYILSLGDGNLGALTFDPINVTSADHALGNNSTGNGGGTVDTVTYASSIGSFNVAQNSWSYEFFNNAGTALEFFDPNKVGTYDISLTAFDGGVEVASTSIKVNVVPVPGALPLLATVIGGVAWMRRRKAGAA